MPNFGQCCDHFSHDGEPASVDPDLTVHVRKTASVAHQAAGRAHS
jgi:hypothetical protein